MSDWDGSAKNAGLKELGLRGLIQQALHNFRVRNTKDSQFQAYNDYLYNQKIGDYIPGADIESSSSQHQRLMTGNQHVGYSGIPKFTSGEGTRMNPYAGDEYSVGVTGFKGGSSPKDISTSYLKSTYNEGPFKGLSFEDMESYDKISGKTDSAQHITTDMGRYNMKPRWWHYKYKPE